MSRAKVTLEKLGEVDELRELAQRLDAATRCAAAVGRFQDDWDQFTFISSIVEAGSLAGSDVWPTLRCLFDDLSELEQVAAENPQGYVRASLWAGFLAGVLVSMQVTLPSAEAGVGIARTRIMDLEGRRARSGYASTTLKEMTARKKRDVEKIAVGVMYALASSHLRRCGEVSTDDRPMIKDLAADVCRTAEELRPDIHLEPGTVARHYLTKEWCKSAWTTICNAVRDGVPPEKLGI